MFRPQGITYTTLAGWRVFRLWLIITFSDSPSVVPRYLHRIRTVLDLHPAHPVRRRHHHHNLFTHPLAITQCYHHRRHNGLVFGRDHTRA